MGYNNERCYCCADYLIPVCRLWGILTAIGMWGVGVEVTLHHSGLGIYVLCAACLLTFLETIWVMNIFLALCIKDENHGFFRCWDVVLWLDLWKKSVLYFIIALIMFIKPHRILVVISGTTLLLLAILYLIVTYVVKSYTKESLLSGREDAYDRFEDIQDEIDDSLPEPLQMPTIADQDEILQV